MKLVEIKKVALEISSEDWNRLGTLMQDFTKVCDESTCHTCPLEKFCAMHEDPGHYLSALYEFLDRDS